MTIKLQRQALNKFLSLLIAVTIMRCVKSIDKSIYCTDPKLQCPTAEIDLSTGQPKITRHFLCENLNCLTPNQPCQDGVTLTYRNGTFLVNVLSMHNTIRNYLASGNDRQNLNYAVKMEALEHDEELSEMAICSANQCDLNKINSIMPNENCFKLAYRNELAVEHVFHDEIKNMTYNYKIGFPKVLSQLLELHNTEPTKFPLKIPSTIQPNNIARWIQLAADTTKHVGCALRLYHDGGPTITPESKFFAYLSCFYSPEFRYGSDLYEIGLPCSKCRISPFACDAHFVGLCSKIETTTTTTTSTANTLKDSLYSKLLNSSELNVIPNNFTTVNVEETTENSTINFTDQGKPMDCTSFSSKRTMLNDFLTLAIFLVLCFYINKH